MQTRGNNNVERGDRQNQAYGALSPSLFGLRQRMDLLSQRYDPTVSEPLDTTVQDLDTQIQPNTDNPYSDAPLASEPGFSPQQWQQPSLPSFDVPFGQNLGSKASYSGSTIQDPNINQPGTSTQGGSSESLFQAGPREHGQQLRSCPHERPRASASGPDSAQDRVDPSSATASRKDRAMDYATRSPKSTPNFNGSLKQASSGYVNTSGSANIEPRCSSESESVIATGDQDTKHQPGDAQRKRSLLSTPDTREHKRRRRLDNPFPHHVRTKLSTNSTSNLDSILAGFKRLDVFSTDPFTWSADFVLFALTSSQSIDLELGLPSSDARLPSCGKLHKMIFGHHINGYNLLLCVDDMVMRHCGIIEPAHRQALGQYIVRFRRRSPGYQSYCYDKKHPVNFTPERLIDTVELKGVREKELQAYVKSAKMAMKRVRTKEGIIHILHCPIGSIKVSKGKDGQLKYTLL